MSEAKKSEKELAYEILIGVQRIMKGPGKRYWTMTHTRIDPAGHFVDTHKCSVGGDQYWSPAWMTYDPNGPALIIFTTFCYVDTVLLTIDLNDPKSLTRSYLREQFKRAIAIYVEKCGKT